MNIWAAGSAGASASSLLGSSATASSTALQPSVARSTSAAAIEDELTLSTAVETAEDPTADGLLSTVLFPGMPREADGSIHLDDMRTYCHDMRSTLNRRIQDCFEAAGIDTSQSIRLQTGYDGSVVVANDHPQREQIEQLFRDHPELRDRFAEVDGLSSFIRAGEEAIAFQQAYAKNPYAAVQQYSYLFDGSPRPAFSLLIQGDQFTVEFVN